MTRDPALSAYFAEAASWDADRAEQHRRSLRLLAGVAVAGWLSTVACAVALVCLTPLKRVEPFVIRVDNSTGLVDVVPVYAGHTALPQAVTRYFLDHYVTVCERFNFSTAESDYEECGAFHTAAGNQLWYDTWRKSNPASPLNVHRDGSSVRAQVVSISFFRRGSGVSDLAQVRYTKATRTAGGTDERLTHWIATIQYAYGAPSQDPKVRRWNPLGFKIIDFHSEPEVLPEPAAAAPQALTVAGSSASRGSP
jgi:type IV secretion system protein VirB8